MEQERVLRPGATLGRYEVLVKVAQGGMATVWAARMAGSRGFSKLVAIKTMLPHLSDEPDFEAMFLDEATLASRIRHPHVVEIVDVGDEEDIVYLVMEWVNGETMFTLNKRARKQGGIPLPVLLRIASATCAGLHAAHELRDDAGNHVQLVHRDVTPQNVMVTADGIVKLVDFGVAKAIGRAHETRVGGMMKGKVPYLSPEQLTSGNAVDRRSDIFSFGILLYVMVTGRHPFRGPSDTNTMENICTRAPVPLSELTEVHPDLEQIVLRALAKKPEERFATCADLQRALDRVASSLGEIVTDGDVADFVQKMAGDVLSDRNRQIREAIAASDARIAKQGGSGRPPSKRPEPPSSDPTPSNRPLPATFDGFLPVDLGDTGSGSRRSGGGSDKDGALPRPAAGSLPHPSTPPSPAALAPSRTRSTSWGLYAIGGLGLIGGVALAMRAGVIPGPALLAPPSAAPAQVTPEMPSTQPRVPASTKPAETATAPTASASAAPSASAAEGTDAPAPPSPPPPKTIAPKPKPIAPKPKPPEPEDPPVEDAPLPEGTDEAVPGGAQDS